MTKPTLPQQFIARMQERGISASALAIALELNPSRVRRYLDGNPSGFSGKPQTLNSDTLEAIAAYLGVQLEIREKK